MNRTKNTSTHRQGFCSAGLSRTTPFFFIRVGRLNVRLFLDDISHVESVGNYARIHTVSGNYLTLCTIRHLERILPKGIFTKINRGVIVNELWVSTFDSTDVKILNGSQFSFGEGQRREFMSKFNLLTINEGWTG